MERDLLTIKKASELLSVHPNTLRKWDNAGLLKAVRIGPRGDRRYKKSDVMHVLNKTGYAKSTDEISKISSVRSGYYENYAPLLIEKAKLTSQSVIVDTPSGTGDMSRVLGTQGYGKLFYCIDINETLVESAREHLEGGRYVHMIGDAADIDSLVPDQVDAIFCLNGFHIYIDRKDEFIKGCRHILKDGGVLMFDVSTRGLRDSASQKYLEAQSKELERLARKKNVQLQMPTFPNDDTFAEYRRKLENAGLQLRESITFDQWRSVDDLLQETLDIKGRLRPWMPGLSDTERVEIYKAASEYAKKESGVTQINHSRVFFVVTKN